MSLCVVHCCPISDASCYRASAGWIQDVPEQGSKCLMFNCASENNKTRLYVTENQDLRVKH